MIVGARAAQLVEELQVLLNGVGQAVEELVLVHRAVGAALAGRAVVGDDDHDRVIQLAGLIQVAQQPSDFVVGVAQEPGVDLGHPREQPLLLSRQRVPRPYRVEFGPPLAVRAGLAHVRIDGRQLRAIGDDPQLFLPGQDGFPDRLVAHVELPGVALDPLPGGVVRRVCRAGAEIQEEGRVGGDGVRVLDELDGLVGQVCREVIPLVWSRGRRYRVVVVDEVGIPLVGLPAEEAVIPLEPAAQRPLAFG